MKPEIKKRKETFFNFNYIDVLKSIKLLLRRLVEKEIYTLLDLSTIRYSFSKTKSNIVVSCLNKERNEFYTFFLKKYRNKPNTKKQTESKWTLIIHTNMYLENQYNPEYKIMKVFSTIMLLGEKSYNKLLVLSFATRKHIVISVLNRIFSKKFNIAINKFPCTNNWVVRRDDPIKFFNEKELVFNLYSDPPKFVKVKITSNETGLEVKSI